MMSCSKSVDVILKALTEHIYQVQFSRTLPLICIFSDIHGMRLFTTTEIQTFRKGDCEFDRVLSTHLSHYR